MIIHVLVYIFRILGCSNMIIILQYQLMAQIVLWHVSTSNLLLKIAKHIMGKMQTIIKEQDIVIYNFIASTSGSCLKMNVTRIILVPILFLKSLFLTG